jgi:hypothetical protein
MGKGPARPALFFWFNGRSGAQPELSSRKQEAGMLHMGKWVAAALAVAVMNGPAAAQTATGAQAQQADEITVTARRIGIPVWRVTGPQTSIVLIGSIDGVAKDTRWDPGALEATLRKSDQVMFPNTLGLTGSPFALVGYYMKWRKQATLPKGQTLANFLPPAQFQRLVVLKNRGVLKEGFERMHPLHLALKLRDSAEGKNGGGREVDGYVRKTMKKHKVKSVPILSMKAKTALNDFFSTPPQTYVPCLVDSITMAEAGPAAFKARSDAWAERQVPAVLNSPVDKVYETCSPVAWGVVSPPALQPQIRGLMQEPKVTAAVVTLRSLAKPGGVLDNLSAAGFKVSGPAWK